MDNAVDSWPSMSKSIWRRFGFLGLVRAASKLQLGRPDRPTGPPEARQINGYHIASAMTDRGPQALRALRPFGTRLDQNTNPAVIFGRAQNVDIGHANKDFTDACRDQFHGVLRALTG